LRSTTLRTLDQADVIVPNTDLITNQVTNWTLTDRHARIIVRVKVATGPDVGLVIQTLKESALTYPGVMQKPEPTVLLHSFGGGAMEFEVHAWIVDVDLRLQAESDLYQALERRFRELGITPE
jgi:small-conductance mechanosensitive channel